MNKLQRAAVSMTLAASCIGAGAPSFCLERSSMQSTSTDFSLKLFREQAKDKTENLLVSPFSAYFALSMVLNGAGGKTREQMAEVLGTTADQVDQMNEKNAEIMKALSANEKIQLEIADAIYSDKDVPFKKEFIETCERFYQAEAHSEDFGNPDVVTQINAWCSQKTHGKITEILKKLDKSETMVLLNAIYFKGTWQDKFPKTATKDDQFTTPSGSKVPIRMMHETEKAAYFEGSNFRSVALPYAGGKQRMYIFLPNQGVDIKAFAGEFTKDSWSQWNKSYRSTQVILSLPKFKIEYSTELTGTLKAMGMADAFHRGANFSNLISPDKGMAWISRVLQKTYMDVNEEGTEAAAVTAVMVATMSAYHAPIQQVEFRVDRPFVIALVDEPTDEILFLGSIVKP
jgi:serine protease inhibitor